MSNQTRVLVVDDDHNCRLLLSSLMAKEGYHVDAVADGEMALAMVRSRPPEIVLLDAHLPRLDGFEVCKQLKASIASKQIQIVMVTGYATDDARARGLEVGADEFLEKPFRTDTVLEVIRHLLAIREVAKQLDLGEEPAAYALPKAPST